MRGSVRSRRGRGKDFGGAWDAPAFCGRHAPAARMSAGYIITGLTAGSNVFTAKYRVSANTGTFQNRNISVIDMGS